MADPSNLTEQLVAQAIALGLSSQLDQAETVDVEVQTNLLQLLQGQAEAITLTGSGLVSSSGLSAQELELQVESVAINPLSSLMGKPELNQPLAASLHLVLNETDLQRLINTRGILQKIFPQEFQVSDRTVTASIVPPLKISLPGAGRITIQGQLEVQESHQTECISCKGVLQHRAIAEPVRLETFTCDGEGGLALDLAEAVLRRLRVMGQQQGIRRPDLTLRVTKLQVETGQLTLEAEVHLRQIP